ncbi:type II toxin-antitoxin system antitoxin MazE7 [Mycobacterium sp.]|uniref:type II toxin-antitoxin system antitoxin MazE7 n=1 Tax=Mycobacterium sp. TaxID=1785 RepID=UPI003F9C4512
MSTETTTIRVPVRTRDRLAAQADERGISVAALVTELADQAERDAVFAAEREYTRTAVLNPEVIEEQRLWENTLEDGVA